MQRNNIKYTSLALYSVASFVMVFTAITPRASAAAKFNNYKECVAYMGKVKDVSKIREKAIYPAVDKRQQRLDELLPKLNKTPMPDEYKPTLKKLIDDDKKQLSEIKDASSKDKDIQHLRSYYCRVYYEVQVYQLRSRQIGYVKHIQTNINRDNAMLAALDKPNNTKYNSAFKAEADAYYDLSRRITNQNLSVEKDKIKTVLAAKVVPGSYENNLAKLDLSWGGASSSEHFRDAYNTYTSANAMRKAAATLPTKSNPKFKEVKLLTKDQKPATHARDASFANVTVNRDGKDQVVQMQRDSRKSPWKIASAGKLVDSNSAGKLVDDNATGGAKAPN